MKHINELRRLLRRGTTEQMSARVEKLGTSVAYIEKLAGGWGVPSIDLGARLIKITPGLTFDHFIMAKRERDSLHRAIEQSKKRRT